MLSDAYIEGEYRYWLIRAWGVGRLAVFLMLNPSTADAQEDDATIRKCTAFVTRWGYDGFIVVNLFALRSRDPSALYSHPEPVGPRNDEFIQVALALSDTVVCGWGKHGEDFPERVRHVLGLIGSRARCLRLNKGGSPAHPLFLPGSLRPEIALPSD